MAISSRLALWEQKIREEDRTPLPTSPPPLFSVIPGGFIKQLVRETEKEAKSKEKIPLNSKEDPPGKQDDGSAQQPFVIKDTTNILEVGGNMAQGRLNGEKNGGEGLAEIPERKSLPFKRSVQKSGNKHAAVSESALKSGEKSPSEKSPVPEESKSVGAKDPGTGAETAKKVHSLWSKRLETLGKENVKTRTKEESMGRMGSRAKGTSKIGENKEKIGESGKKTGETKEETGKKVGENKEKTGESGKKAGENKEKAGEIRKKTGENKEITGDIGGKLGENKEKTGDVGKKTGESKEKTREIGKKIGENKEKMGDIGKKLGENKEKTRDIGGKVGENKENMGEIKRKMGETKEKMGLIGEILGESKEKLGETGKKPGESKEKTGEIRKKTVETKEKTGEIGDKMGESKEKINIGRKTGESNEKRGENGRKMATEDKTRETEEKPVEEEGRIGKEEKEKMVETEEKMAGTKKMSGGEMKNDLGESTDSSSEKDVWYETEKVWLVQKDGFALATELKPDVGTPELPPGMVRVRIEADGSVFEVEEDKIQKTNPSRFDYAEDLASLVSLNESSVLHTLRRRFQSQLVYTYAGQDLIAVAPYSCANNGSRKAFKGKRDGMSPHIFSMAQRAYWAMLTQRQDQTIMPLGRSSSGKTTCCQNALEYLVEMAGSVDNRVTVDKIRAVFAILRAFGTVSAGRNRASTRFSMVMALDFNAAGRVTAAHLQTMLLERSRVAQQPDGESNFNVFAQMLAGLDLDLRTILHLHQTAENNSFGIKPCLKAEEKQEAAAAFSKLRSAMGTLGISAREQEAVWRVLAAIFHLGAAGVCRVGRKQFLKSEAAGDAAEALGCGYEDLSTAVFKHHLRRIIAQAAASVTAGQRRRREEEDPSDGPKMTGVECVEGMAAGLYEELFAAIVSLINRSFSSTHLSMASILVVDAPGFHNPRHERKERAATFEEFCRNYANERLRDLFHRRTFASALERYRDENIEVPFDLPDFSPASTVALVDQNYPSQVALSPSGHGDDPKGLLWILDEEALVQGSNDGIALGRLCSYFAKEAASEEGPGFLRKCEQASQFEIGHQLGQDPVRYDATGWVSKAKWNLSAENAVRVLQESKIEAIKELFGGRSKVPLICRSVSGLEGVSQQALQRVGCVRKTFAGSFAAVKRKSVCAQIKLQMDALANLVKRTQIHFVHCLLPKPEADGAEEMAVLRGGGPATWDIPSLRVQLSGGQILDALRLHRIGYADRMVLTQFRRRFQILAQPVMKKYTSAYETTDEKKALEELFQALDLEKKSVAVGRTQVFLKSGVLPRLEKQREKMAAQNLSLLQAACKGFLSRQKYKKLKVQRLAVQCIQKNLVVFQRVRTWAWWRLMGRIRPLLTTTVAEGQLRAKEEELMILRKKLENSEISRQELRQNVELLETKTIDLMTELSDERLKGEAACRVLDAERAERLKGLREIRELQKKHDELQKKLEAVEKQLEESQEQLQLREIASGVSGKGEEWRLSLDCAQTEIGFLRKRIAQMEERLEAEQAAKKEMEEKLTEAQNSCEGARRTAQQLKRKCVRLSSDLEDTRLLMENQQSRSHELEKKQKKFDLQLAQALGESAFEKSLREKITQENTVLQFNLGTMQQKLEQKESENSHLRQRIEVLGARIEELGSSENLDPNTAAVLQKKLWDLEDSSSEQQKELSLQAKSIEQLEQLHLRLELEIERMRQLHQKEMEDKEDELEDVRQSCQKRLRQLEMQCEQETEEKQRILHEKRDLEGLIATLCEQIGHRDFDVEKRLRRDLKRSHALLADVQLLLETSGSESGPSGAKEEVEKLRTQWEETAARYAEAQKSQKTLASELENLQTELENIVRNKNLVDEQLYQIQHEKADLLKRIDEDQEDLNELMEKHKALIAQSAKDISQIRELQTQLEETKKEKRALQEKLQVSQARLVYLEQATVERSIVSRQEALICDLENKMEFQSVQIKRFEMLVLRLRDSVIKMGEELEKAREGEAREKENAGYYKMRMEEMKAEAKEMAERELEANRRRVELEKQVDELSAVRQTLQADLETSIRRIADLQAALEEVQSSDESDTESVQTARESLTSRHDTESVLSLPSTVSLNLGPNGSAAASWAGSASGWSSPPGSSLAGGLARPSLDTRSNHSLRIDKDQERSQDAASPLGARRRQYGENGGAESPNFGVRRRGVSGAEFESVSPSVVRRFSSPISAEDNKSPPRSSSALSEYVEELRRKRLKDEEPGDAASLPIYQTAGASSLRRRRSTKDDEEFATNEFAASAGTTLVRSSSLRSVSSENAARPPALKKTSKFGSYDSLVQDLDERFEKFGGDASRAKPWRSSLEASLEESADDESRREPLVFQSKRLGGVLGETNAADPFSWKIPTLSYERKMAAEADDFPPAIRKAQSATTLSKGPRERSVRFEDQVAPERTFLSEINTVLSPGAARTKEDPGNLSDDSSSSSSGSVVSFKSADSVKSRPKVQRPEGEGCVQKAAIEGAKDDRRSEAEGKEDDVNSIMMKYLGKE